MKVKSVKSMKKGAKFELELLFSAKNSNIFLPEKSWII